MSTSYQAIGDWWIRYTFRGWFASLGNLSERSERDYTPENELWTVKFNKIPYC